MRGIIIKSVVGILIAVAAFFAVNATMSPAEAAGCSGNSVIKCGVWSVSEMRQKYNSDYTKGTKEIFTGMGVTSQMVNHARVVDGLIYKNGDVKVNGKTVATDAVTAGRWHLSGGKNIKHVDNGTTWYERDTETSFKTKEIWKVFVFLDDEGRFIGAVMLDCGNPVRAKNVVVPPKPSYVCNSLSAKTLSRTDRSFTASASVKNGAKVKSYTFDFGDGQKKTTTSKTISHSYAKPGSYNVKVTVNFTVNGKTYSKSANNCIETVKIAKPPVKDIKVCDLGTKKIITIREDQFNSKQHSKNLADCEIKYIKVCELATKTIVTIKEDNFDSKKYSKNLSDCDTNYIEVCELATKAIVTIDEDDFDANKHSKNLADCDAPIKVCDLKTKEIITIDEKDFNPETQSKVLADCDTPIEVCELDSKQVVTIDEKDFDAEKYSKDLTDCEETPETPETPVTELPQTGVSGAVSSVFGLVSLAGAATYYLNSRRF